MNSSKVNCPSCSKELPCVADLPSATGLEFTLFECVACGAHALHCFSTVGAYAVVVNVGKDEAARMRTLQDAELKSFMRRWAEENF